MKTIKSYNIDDTKFLHHCNVLKILSQIKILTIWATFPVIRKLEQNRRSEKRRSVSYLPTYDLPKYKMYDQRRRDCMRPCTVNELPKGLI